MPSNVASEMRRQRCSLARSFSSARWRSVTSRATHTARSSSSGDVAAANQRAAPSIVMQYSKCTVRRLARHSRIRSR